MRHIIPEIWQDDFILDLDHFERLLWLGLILTVADDQGRLENNLRRIKIKIFPVDDCVKVDQIKRAIAKFVKCKKLYLYSASGKELIQIIHWWTYQSAAQYMGISEYPPPEGWIDSYRYSAPGEKPGTLIVSKTWKKRNTKGVTLNDDLIATWGKDV